ncbi:MAG TPA: response regulator transcription factor [Longimicrobiales bacterium]|nr:response regulator transcription factor [Longimicrobiales bacterium]
MATILIIEDNPDLAFGLINNLEIEGHAVELVTNGADGLRRARTLKPDLVVLDLMLPGLNGYGVLKGLREAQMQTPVLILSARGEEADKLRGFRYGADDYVTKPFSLLELLARVDALLRRSRAGAVADAAAAEVERFGDVEVVLSTRSVRKRGQEVSLPPKAYDLLVALLERRGKVTSRMELLRAVWGHRVAVMTRTVDTHVAELRRKLEDDPANPRYIITVRKSGYRIDTP